MSVMSTRVGGNLVSLDTHTCEGTLMFSDGCKAVSSIYPFQGVDATIQHVTVAPWGNTCYAHRTTSERDYVACSEVVASLDLLGIVALNY